MSVSKHKQEISEDKDDAIPGERLPEEILGDLPQDQDLFKEVSEKEDEKITVFPERCFGAGFFRRLWA